MAYTQRDICSLEFILLEAALKTVWEMGGGVLEQFGWGLNLITNRIVTFQQNMENAIDIICKSDVSAMKWEGKTMAHVGYLY